jgi:chromosome segregation ATPase
MKIYRIASVFDPKIVKLAVSDGEFRDLKDKISSIKDDIRNLKRDDKDFESRLKKIEKTINSLNLGNRMFTETKDIFTSLQRKIERLEATSFEWKNYKKEMDADVKKMVEKHTKARIGDIAPKAY